MRKILLSLFIISALAACKKDETLRYNNVTMGNIHGEEIISDQGNTFVITESLFSVDLNEFTSERVMLSCDVLRETAEKTYDIRLTGITSVLTKNIKTFEETTAEEDLTADDPVIIRDLWYAGGYLNMSIEIAQKKGSETPHYINLVHDILAAEDGKYTFILRHNAQGEVPSEEDREFSTGSGYVSFPIANFIKEDAAEIVLVWNSHKFMGSGHSLIQTERLKHEAKWERIGFEQNPSKSSKPSMVMARYK
jgi:hypothetical protein